MKAQSTVQILNSKLRLMHRKHRRPQQQLQRLLRKRISRKRRRQLAKQKSWQLFSEKWMKRRPKTVPCLRSAEAALYLLCSWLHKCAVSSYVAHGLLLRCSCSIPQVIHESAAAFSHDCDVSVAC